MGGKVLERFFFGAFFFLIFLWYLVFFLWEYGRESRESFGKVFFYRSSVIGVILDIWRKF